jgi:hypothetical protein
VTTRTQALVPIFIAAIIVGIVGLLSLGIDTKPTIPTIIAAMKIGTNA